MHFLNGVARLLPEKFIRLYVFLPSKLKPMACFELKTPALAAFIPLHPFELSLFARLQVREKTA